MLQNNNDNNNQNNQQIPSNQGENLLNNHREISQEDQ